MHVVLRSPHQRIDINRLNEGIVWQASGLLSGGDEVLHVAKVVVPIGEVIPPHRVLCQQREAGNEPTVGVDFPALVRRLEQVEDGGRVVDEHYAVAPTVIHISGRGAGVDERAIAQGLAGNRREPVVAYAVVVRQAR